MSSIGVSDADKAEFKELKPNDLTQKEFFGELLEAFRRDNGEIVNIEEMVAEINKQVASECELSAYRGTKEALEELNTE